MISGLFNNGQAVDRIVVGDKAQIVLDKTPFYAESGGQIGDRGIISLNANNNNAFEVVDTQKQGDIFLHQGELEQGALKVGDAVLATVDQARRQAIVLNHSATHLMHKALRDVLGEHVSQKGSLVMADRLRFDFSHFEPMTIEQIATVETLVNQQIRNNQAANAKVMAMDEAVNSGAMALFGEKYGDEVRVVNIGYSTELCGGVHVQRAGDIGLFKIMTEGGVASGVRRIEAVTGEGALAWITEQNTRLQTIAARVKASPTNVTAKVDSLFQKNKALEKEIEQLKGKLASKVGSDLSAGAIDVNGIKVLAVLLKDADPKSLRETVDQLKNKLGKAVVVLATVKEKKVSLIAGVTKAETSKYKAGELINHVAAQVGGKGGGRADMAQAGGSQPENITAALASVEEWVQTKY